MTLHCLANAAATITWQDLVQGVVPESTWNQWYNAVPLVIRDTCSTNSLGKTYIGGNLHQLYLGFPLLFLVMGVDYCCPLISGSSSPWWQIVGFLITHVTLWYIAQLFNIKRVIYIFFCKNRDLYSMGLHRALMMYSNACNEKSYKWVILSWTWEIWLFTDQRNVVVY